MQTMNEIEVTHDLQVSLNIDIFRTILAQWVILSHFGAEFLPIALVPGRLAVWCFFVISGYLNMISFQHKLDCENWFYAARSYYASRFWRIYPLLILSYLVVSLIVGSFRNDDFWVLFPAVHSSTSLQITNGVLWTIIIELQLYLLTPLLFYVAKSVKSWHWVLLGAIALMMVIKIPIPDDRTMLGNLGYYLFGMALAASRARLIGISPRLQSWLWVVLVVLFVSFFERYNFHSQMAQFSRGPYIAVLASFLVLTCMSSLIFRGQIIFRFLGYYTYEIYVLHGLFVLIYHKTGLSGSFSAVITWWAMPLLCVYLYDMLYKKKYRSLKLSIAQS